MTLGCSYPASRLFVSFGGQAGLATIDWTPLLALSGVHISTKGRKIQWIVLPVGEFAFISQFVSTTEGLWFIRDSFDGLWWCEYGVSREESFDIAAGLESICGVYKS